MTTATEKACATTDANRGRGGASNSASMEFLIVEDNGGDYHWTLLDGDRNSLARSPSFGAYKHAEDAARVVLAGAGSARLDRRAANGSSLDTPPNQKLPMTVKQVDRAEGRSTEATGVSPVTTA
jgi:hypothetical protein